MPTAAAHSVYSQAGCTARIQHSNVDVPLRRQALGVDLDSLEERQHYRQVASYLSIPAVEVPVAWAASTVDSDAIPVSSVKSSKRVV